MQRALKAVLGVALAVVVSDAEWTSKCPASCSQYGTCNEDTGECACPPYPHGPAQDDNPCGLSTMPACELQPGFYSPCGHMHNARTSCECLQQCDEHNVLFTPSCYEMTTAMHDSASSGNGTVALQLLGMTGRLPVVDFHSKHALSGPALKEMDANFVAAAPDRCDDRCSNKGWCSAHGFCVCFFGFKGRSCGEVDDAVYCSNSCSAHGVCMSGFCQCDKGFFGTDCSLTKADDGTTLTSYQRWAARVGPEAVLNASWAGEGLAARPRIYVYELPPRFNAWLLYHHYPSMFNSIYSAGRFLHDRLLASEFRTTNPEEADFFFVPVWGRAAGFGPPRAKSRYLKEVQKYIAQYWPYWDRKGGADHLWVLTDDHGACDEFGANHRVTEIENSIFLTHFGYRGGAAPAYGKIDDSPCHLEGHDIVIPPCVRAPWEDPAEHARAEGKHNEFMFGGNARLSAPVPRDGHVHYSHGVRQKVVKDLADKPGFLVYDGRKGSYNTDMADSQFCLAPTGSGWGIRIVEDLVAGCLPVIIQDNVTQPFEDVLPYERFSVRVLEADIDRLPDILATISESKRRDMRAEAACAWRAMVWSSVHGSFTGADDDTTDAMAVLIHTLRGRLGLDGAVGSQAKKLESACDVLPSVAAGPRRTPLCQYGNHQRAGCLGRPRWHWIGMGIPNWPSGGAAAMSRPGWYESPSRSLRFTYQITGVKPGDAHSAYDPASMDPPVAGGFRMAVPSGDTRAAALPVAAVTRARDVSESMSDRTSSQHTLSRHAALMSQKAQAADAAATPAEAALAARHVHRRMPASRGQFR